MLSLQQVSWAAPAEVAPAKLQQERCPSVLHCIGYSTDP